MLLLLLLLLLLSVDMSCVDELSAEENLVLSLLQNENISRELGFVFVSRFRSFLPFCFLSKKSVSRIKSKKKT